MSIIHHAFPSCVLTAQDIALIKRKFDRTCEELGVFPEDEGARRDLGKALVAAMARGELALDAPEADGGETETICFEGEEITVPVARVGH